MSNEILKRDGNSAVCLSGITDDASLEIRMLRVDPVTNRLLVSGTGGGSGSGYQAPLTGAVDGANDTFTWTTAPKVLMIDRVPTQKTSSDGTSNWTGTTTTVLLVTPPAEDLFAVA